MAEAGGPRGGKCPICGAAAEHRYRPFCSRRCADIDLARWFNGSYAVPVVELDESDLDALEEFGEGDDEPFGERRGSGGDER